MKDASRVDGEVIGRAPVQSRVESELDLVGGRQAVAAPELPSDGGRVRVKALHTKVDELIVEENPGFGAEVCGPSLTGEALHEAREDRSLGPRRLVEPAIDLDRHARPVRDEVLAAEYEGSRTRFGSLGTSEGCGGEKQQTPGRVHA